MNLRLQKVNSLLMREISTILHQKMNDPHIGRPSVTAVKVGSDLRSAKVYIDSSGNSAKDDHLIDSLEKARSFIQKELGEAVTLRYLPELHFQIDKTNLNAERIEQIIQKLHEKDDNG